MRNRIIKVCILLRLFIFFEHISYGKEMLWWSSCYLEYFQMVPWDYKIHCHCFTGDFTSAKLWLDHFPNLYIGLTPLVTYRTATGARDVAKFISLSRLLLESDAPYFVPKTVSVLGTHLK